MLLAAETLALCLVFWAMCWLGTGSDQKNLKSFSAYTDEIQRIVRQDPILGLQIKESNPRAAFVSNAVLFTILFFPLGWTVKTESFLANFIRILIMGQVLNAFDFFVIDLMWFRHSPRTRFSATKGRPDLYLDPKNHCASFLRGIPCFLLVALIDGILLTLF